MLSCLNRYTGTAICAIRCDGRDDLCKDFSDEMNCKGILTTTETVLVAVIVSSVLAVIFNLMERFIVKGKSGNVNRSIGSYNISEMLEFSEYLDLREKENFGATLGNAVFLRSNCHDPFAMKKFCLKIYNFELRYMLQHERLERLAIALTDDFFYEKLGTTKVTKLFLDNVYGSLGTRLIRFCARRALSVWDMLHTFYTMKVLNMMKLMLSIFFYYFDLIKDIVLLSLMIKVFSRIGNFSSDLPSLLLLTAILSIMLALLANMISVLNFKPWSQTQRFFGALLILFVPGAIRYRIYKIKSIAAKKDRSDTDLLFTRTEIQAFKTLKAELRNNENSLEQLPQLIILILLYLIHDTKTVNVVTGSHFAVNLLGEDQGNFTYLNKSHVLIFSATFSLISLVRGQMGLGISLGRGFVPLKGKLLLMIYYCIGTLARLFAVVLFFTPNLGLLDTRHHSKSGQLSAEIGSSVFDVENGTAKFFNETWNNYYKLGEKGEVFYQFPKAAMVCAFPLLLITHLILSLLFCEAIYCGFDFFSERERMLNLLISSSRGLTVNKGLGWSKKILENLNTLLCPPIHWDWEFLHRLKGGPSLSISECWRRSKRLLVAFNFLIFVEHLLLMVPLVVLKVAIDDRNEKLSKDFPQNSDEILSTERVNLLLYLGLCGFTALPLISLLAAVQRHLIHTWASPKVQGGF